MDEVLKQAKALADALRGSDVYNAYRRERIRVAENPALADNMLTFKKKQAAFELKRLQNQPVTFDEEKHISHLYAELSQNETAKRYLDRESAFLNVYRQVTDMLNDACEIDITYQ